MTRIVDRGLAQASNPAAPTPRHPVKSVVTPLEGLDQEAQYRNDRRRAEDGQTEDDQTGEHAHVQAGTAGRVAQVPQHMRRLGDAATSHRYRLPRPHRIGAGLHDHGGKAGGGRVLDCMIT